MSERKYYCFCDSNCKYETMTKEQILATIAQMIETGTVKDVDTGFVSKIKEKNTGAAVTFWVGTQAQYNQIGTPDVNCLYIITDDPTMKNIEEVIVQAIEGSERAAAAAAEAVETAKKAFRRGFNVTGSTSPSMMSANKDSLFYIIEIASKEQPAVRHTIAVDHFTLISGSYLSFPNCGATVYGSTDGEYVFVWVTEGWKNSYGLTRFTGYCGSAGANK